MIYPLEWPVGWPRTEIGKWQNGRFGLRQQGFTVIQARKHLIHELGLLGASGTVISSNWPCRKDGDPFADAKEPVDRGVAVHFRLEGEQRVLACDRWLRVGDNLQALAKHVEAIRGQLRWGVGSIAQAFGGYKMLLAMGASKPWHEILRVDPDAAWETIERRRRELLAEHHPDRGGTHAQAAEINEAFDNARRERRIQP